MITNIEIFEQFYQDVKNAKSMADIVKEYGGSPVYVPSYKSYCRNDDILNDFRKGMSIKELAKKYDLSDRNIYSITKEERLGG
ncbi:MAG: Unknown protein [uncultured Sulfurovum sp.]|uniref:Mor transcription activator domain-containing protein n=1 Tax=uncultured Sulfurovum sp. TaxID=269237 RepID=A0A6S6S8I2_9BACT|nr:MAG: Unknown protein [uncultured Sulfurovum sp.]